LDIIIKNLTKLYNNTVALTSLSCTISHGEITAILGTSGSGKTTLLNLLAGIVQPTSGSIFFDNKDIANSKIEDRNVGYVFQDYALYPHMTVYENIAFPLLVQRIKKDKIKEKVFQYASLLHIEDLLKRKPNAISGGQQQRVAIARALIKEPSLLLLDEPFANLDNTLSQELQEEFKVLQKKTAVTSIYVTHNRDEAISISDSIMILDGGKLVQKATPYGIYSEPCNRFVADFISKPPCNYISGKIKNGLFMSRENSIFVFFVQLEGKTYDNVTLMVRSEHVSILENKKCEDALYAYVESIKYQGDRSLLHLRVGSDMLRTYAPNDVVSVGERLCVGLNQNGLFVFESSSGVRLC